MAKKEENIQLIRGYCDPRCIFYEKRKIVSFTSETHTMEIDICNYNGTARSFGCMNGCLNGIPQLEPIRKEE